MKQTFAIGIGGAAGQGVATPGDISAKGDAVVAEKWDRAHRRLLVAETPLSLANGVKSTKT
jgi:hypothetical protein